MPSPLARLRLRLEPESLETRYRLATLSRNKRALAAILFVAMAFQAINIPLDLMVLAPGPRFRLALATRLFGVAISFAALRMLPGLRSPERFVRITVTWGILTALSVVMSFVLPSGDYVGSLAWSTLLVLAMYVALPIPIPLQALVAATFTAGDAVLLTVVSDLADAALPLDVLTAHACAHAIGVVASWQFQRARRDQFLAFREAEHAHTQEQRAWGELKVLQGILPICAHCRKVRTDTGDWSRLEVYVQRHSEAAFSHGICPECEAREFGTGPAAAPE